MPAKEPMKVSQLGTVEAERVADDEPGGELDQGDRQPDLDRDRRGEQDRACEECCYRDVAHALPPGVERQLVEAIGSGEERLGGGLTPLQHTHATGEGGGALHPGQVLSCRHRISGLPCE